MSNSGQGKVTVYVKVVVEGGGTSSVETSSVEKQSRGGIRLLQTGISYPQPCPSADTTIVSQSGGVNYIEAWGDAPRDDDGNLPWQVWALAYNSTGVSTTQHQKPDPGAVSATYDSSTGHWSFLQADNKLVPGAKCESTSCSAAGTNNSTLLVWYDYGSLGSPNYSVVPTLFRGYCPGSGSSGSAPMPEAVAVGSHRVATTLHASFTGALEKLGTVALTWNGVSWAGLSSCGGAVLSFLGHCGAFQLQSVGPATSFIVAAKSLSPQPFSWSAEGTALGALAGPFGVTIME